jgi:hypothetical protein
MKNGRRMRGRTAAAAVAGLAGVLWALAGAAPAEAQYRFDCPSERPTTGCVLVEHTPRWVGHFTVLSSNAFVGGLTGGIAQRLRGGSFRDGFARGALGGAVVYAGKRIVVEDFDGAGLLGRQVAAVGSSVVRNAADGRPSLERLVFPLGPVRLYVDRGAEARTRVQPRVDLVQLAWLGWAAQEPRLGFDARESLSSGAPVFRVDGLILQPRYTDVETDVHGLQTSGVIFLSDIPEWMAEFNLATLPHERVHVLQDDYLFLNWAEPATRPFLDRLPARGIGRYLDLNGALVVHAALELLLSREHQPWELEADFLAGQR